MSKKLKVSGSTLRKIEKVIARGWQPGMNPKTVLRDRIWNGPKHYTTRWLPPAKGTDE